MIIALSSRTDLCYNKIHMAINPSFLETLKSRGFIAQTTQGIESLDQQAPFSAYIGFDPSAASLTVGHLVQIMMLSWVQKTGSRPIVIVGGGTGLIGDPSGKTQARVMLTSAQVKKNLQSIKKQLSRFLDFNQALILNNADWLSKLDLIEFLRDITTQFSVNRLLTHETYQERLRKQLNLSLMEFLYPALQAYDYWYLYKKYNCRLQMGGNDQWFNILAGVELIKKLESATVHALTSPLLTTTQGQKMGKTEKGAIWLNAKLTPPYDFYQFWINVDDADVIRFLKLFTFLPLEKVTQYEDLTGADIRQAKKALAYEVTKLVHSEVDAQKAQAAAEALFENANEKEAEAIPTHLVNRDRAEIGIDILDLLTESGLASSKTQAKRLVEQGGTYINNQRLKDAHGLIGADYFQGENLFLRVGKKRIVQVKMAH